MKDNFGKALAYLRTLAMFYQTAHWQSKGSFFYQDHLLFERLYNSVNAEIDGLAEKAIAITDTSVVNLSSHLKDVSEMADKLETEAKDNIYFAQQALALEKQFLEFLGDIQTEGSAGTKNMIAGIADAHETNVYLLTQRTTK